MSWLSVGNEAGEVNLSGSARRMACLLSCLALLLVAASCGRSELTDRDAVAATEESPVEAPQEETSEAEATTTDLGEAVDVAHALSEAQQKLQAGEIDSAAAELLRVQMSGGQFDADQAAAYREALGQATAAAVSAAEQGDPRGQAALQMLRAARRR